MESHAGPPREGGTVSEQLAACPVGWRKHWAGYATDALVSRYWSDLQFGDRRLRRLYHSAGRFAIHCAHASVENKPRADDLFLSAVLQKLCHRGLPAWCSLHCEWETLRAALQAGFTTFSETGKADYDFSLTPFVDNFDELVRACFVPELLVPECEYDFLRSAYLDLCTPPEQRFFEELTEACEALGEKRLSLCFVPQVSFADLCAGSDTDVDDLRVDFAGSTPLRHDGSDFGYVVEIDDSSHDDRKTRDQQRDSILAKHGWTVRRVALSGRGNLKEAAQDLADQLHAAVGGNAVRAGRDLRESSHEKQKAIIGLTRWPIAEAQLTHAVAEIVRMGINRDLKVFETTLKDAKVLCEDVNRAIRAITKIHTLDHFPTLSEAENLEEADIVLSLTPHSTMWSSNKHEAIASIAPYPLTAPFDVKRAQNAQPLREAMPRKITCSVDDPDDEAFKGFQWYLQNAFRKRDFLRGQKRIIARAAAREAVLGLLPTGGGKSLCYQLVSITQPGMAIVVQPLRSLMHDQERNMRRMGLHTSVALYSEKEATAAENRAFRERTYRSMAQGRVYFCLVSPERLQIPEFRERLEALTSEIPVPYAVIDEAHCVSEWGHDFRPAYLDMADNIRHIAGFRGMIPSLLALTATASGNVQLDVLRELDISSRTKAVVRPSTLDRDELNFDIVRTTIDARADAIGETVSNVISEHANSAKGDIPKGLLFTFFVNPRDLGVKFLTYLVHESLLGSDEDFSGYSCKDHTAVHTTEPGTCPKCDAPLVSDLDKPLYACPDHPYQIQLEPGRCPDCQAWMRAIPADAVGFYSGGRPKHHSAQPGGWQHEKEQIQERFAAGETRILACTHSFGMGIDVPDIRFAVHVLLPRSMEEWYQQAGRAGRDRQESTCVLIFTDDTPDLADRLLDPSRTPVEELEQERDQMGMYEQPDAIRNLWFQTQGFPGEQHDNKILQWLVETKLAKVMVVPLGSTARVRLSFSAFPPDMVVDEYQDKDTLLEKQLFRLRCIGLIEDYEKDHAAQQFHIRLRHLSPEQLHENALEYLLRYFWESQARRFLPQSLEENVLDAAVAVGKGLNEFVYTHIERRRRRAQLQMLRLGRTGVEEGVPAARKELLMYLDESKFSARVQKIARDIVPEEWLNLLQETRMRDDADKLLGACRRELEDNPSHPGLLLLAGICQMRSARDEPGKQDLRNAVLGLREEIPDDRRRSRWLMKFAREVVRFGDNSIDQFLTIVLDVDITENDLDRVREIYKMAPEGSQSHYRTVNIIGTQLCNTIGCMEE